MNLETRKLKIISDFLNIEDPSIMNEIEAILIREKSEPTKTSLEKFAGIWTKGEANEMKKIITEGCG